MCRSKGYANPQAIMVLTMKWLGTRRKMCRVLDESGYIYIIIYNIYIYIFVLYLVISLCFSLSIYIYKHVLLYIFFTTKTNAESR